MPAADSCRTVRVDRSTLSPDSGTCNRPPAIRMTAFNAQPPNLQPAPLMDVDFAVIGQLVRHRMPHIRFLSIGSRLCSTLPSDPASRRRPCASLSLLLHRDVKGTYTPKLSIMRGVPIKAGRRQPSRFLLWIESGHGSSQRLGGNRLHIYRNPQLMRPTAQHQPTQRTHIAVIPSPG